MKKYKNIIALILIILIISIGYISMAKDDYSSDRFKIIYESKSGFGYNIAIIADMYTLKEYLFVKIGYGAGLTELKKE